MNNGGRAFTPFVCGLFDTNGDRHAKAGHSIEGLAPDSCLRLLIGQHPGVKTPPNDGLVAKHRGFNKGHLVLERGLASGLLQGGKLHGGILVFGPDARIAVFHASVIVPTYRIRNPLISWGGFFVQRLTRCGTFVPDLRTGKAL